MRTFYTDYVFKICGPLHGSAECCRFLICVYIFHHCLISLDFFISIQSSVARDVIYSCPVPLHFVTDIEQW